MAQITWKNVAGPSFGGASAEANAASRHFTQAANSIDSLLKAGREVTIQQQEDQSKLLHAQLTDQFAGAESLEELRGMPSNASLMQQYGADVIDPEAVNAARSNQENILRDVARKTAMASAMEIYDKTGSAAEAQKVYIDSLDQQGVRDSSVLDSAMTSYNQTAGRLFKVAGDEAEEAANNQFIELFKGKDVTKMTTADALSLAPKDADKDLVLRVFGDMQKQQVEFADQANFGKIVQTLVHTGNTDAALAAASDMSAEAYMQATNFVTNETNRILNSPQGMIYQDQAKRVIDGTFQGAENEMLTVEANLESAEKGLVFQPGFIEAMEKRSTGESLNGIVAELTQNQAKDGWFWGTGEKGTSSEALNVYLSKKRAEIKQANRQWSYGEIDAVLVHAFNETGGRGKNRESNPGKTLPQLDKSISNAVEQFNYERAYREDYKGIRVQIAKDREEIQRQKNTMGLQMRQQIIQAGLQRKAITFSQPEAATQTGENIKGAYTGRSIAVPGVKRPQPQYFSNPNITKQRGGGAR